MQLRAVASMPWLQASSSRCIHEHYFAWQTRTYASACKVPILTSQAQVRPLHECSTRQRLSGLEQMAASGEDAALIAAMRRPRPSAWWSSGARASSRIVLSDRSLPAPNVLAGVMTSQVDVSNLGLSIVHLWI